MQFAVQAGAATAPSYPRETAFIVTSVALICYANRCRSVMAHAIFVAEVRKRSLAIEVYSAGVADFSDQPPLTETADTCLAHQTPPVKETPTWVGQLPFKSIDRFLVMEHNHADVLTIEFGISTNRISLLGTFDPQRRGAEIADPFGLGRVAYERSYKLIRDCIVGYLDTVDELK
jgi:low molecular weight protein-tyrosine phosphatase